MGRRTTAMAAMALAGVLAACGGNDDDTAATPTAPATASVESDTPAETLGNDRTLEVLGEQLTKSLTGAASFDIDAGVLVVTFSAGDSSAAAAHCQIAIVARDGVGAEGAIRMAYPDGIADCDDLIG